MVNGNNCINASKAKKKNIPVSLVSLPTLIFAPTLNILLHSWEKKSSSNKISLIFLCFIYFSHKNWTKIVKQRLNEMITFAPEVQLII